jgi:hypothetical protein
VVNISMKSPLVIEQSPPSLTLTAIGPGSVADTAAAAAIPPMIWAMNTMQPRETGTAPTRQRVSVT